MAISINVEFNDFTFDFNSGKIIKKIAKVISTTESIKSKHIASIIVVDEQTIKDINKTYRNIDKATDVISFALGDNEKELPYELGDIFICYQKVISQAAEFGHDILREFAFLVTHGIFHLLGYDHLDTISEENMFAKQEFVLKQLRITRNSDGN